MRSEGRRARGRGPRKALGLLGGLLLAGTGLAGPLDQALDETLALQETTRSNQQQVETIREQEIGLRGELRGIEARREALERYHRSLARMVAHQEEELGEIREQLARIDAVRRDLLPLLDRMVTGLEDFVRLDLPFREAERSARLATLRDLLASPDLAPGEKLRRVFEAYQIEEGYGRQIEAWSGPLPGAGGEVGELLRIGRLALYACGPGGSRPRRWDPEGARLVPLAEHWQRPLAAALLQARRQAPPNLLELPLPPPQEARP